MATEKKETSLTPKHCSLASKSKPEIKTILAKPSSGIDFSIGDIEKIIGDIEKISVLRMRLAMENTSEIN